MHSTIFDRTHLAKSKISQTFLQSLTGMNKSEKIQFFHEDKSVAIFCHWVAALVPDMFHNFYLAKIHKIVNNSTTAGTKEENKHIFGIFRIVDIFWCRFY